MSRSAANRAVGREVTQVRTAARGTVVVAGCGVDPQPAPVPIPTDQLPSQLDGVPESPTTSP